MADNVVNLPPRGKTYLSGSNRTIDTTQTTSKAVMGIRKVFKDLDYSSTSPSNTSVKAPRSGGEVTCILVRNSSGVALLPKMLVTWKSGARGKEVDGYGDFAPDAASAGVVDEWLPSTGVPNGDLFWLVVEGPTLCLTAKEADGTNVINVDDFLVSVTAAASTHSTTAGRVIPAISVAGVTTNITFAQSSNLHKIGRAMSAKTTANTNANVLVYMMLP